MNIDQKSLPKKPRNETTVGLIYAVMAITFWGMMPLYWYFLNNINAMGIVAHRTIWAAFCLLFILFFMRKLPELKKAFVHKKVLLRLFISAILIGSNWLIYVMAIHNERVIEASLGYFIAPLLMIVFGMVFFKERLRFSRVLAIIFATLAVFYQAFQFSAIPWYALGLAFSFSSYSAIKKTIPLNGLVSLTIETLLLLPLFLAYLVFFHHQGFWLGATLTEGVLLFGAGIVTALPLVFFANATIRLPLSLYGLLSFISPILTLLIGIFIFKEAFTTTHALTFGGIALALITYTSSIWLRK